MVAIAPFRALRYNFDAVGELARVIAPPYDVISPEQQAQLYQASPFNVVRLILGKQFPDDRDGADRYSRAEQAFDAWRREGVLVRDAAPAISVCEHQFEWDGKTVRRLGVLGLLRFEGSVPSQVLSHEATFEAPKADRAKLLDTVRAHLSPIFCVAPDPSGAVRAWMSRQTQAREPVASATVPFRTSGGSGAPEAIRLWAVEDAAAIQALQRALEAEAVLIADGHHRFEVALSRRHLCPAVLAYFAVMEDPALIVRPYHRMISLGPGQRTRWDAPLQSLCRLTAMAEFGELQRRLDAAQGPGWFGLAGPPGQFLAQVQPPLLERWLATPAIAPALARLDVNILHHAVLPELTRNGSPKPEIRYTPDAQLACSQVAEGQADWVVLLRPIQLPEVFALARRGHVLPQKSTYFYPKVLSGLLFNPFDE